VELSDSRAGRGREAPRPILAWYRGRKWVWREAATCPGSHSTIVVECRCTDPGVQPPGGKSPASSWPRSLSHLKPKPRPPQGIRSLIHLANAVIPTRCTLGVLHRSTSDLWGQIILRGGLSCASEDGWHLWLEARSIPPVATHANVCRLCRMPRGRGRGGRRVSQAGRQGLAGAARQAPHPQTRRHSPWPEPTHGPSQHGA